MTALEELDDFLIRAGNCKKVGVRRKVVLIRKWLDAFIKRHTSTKVNLPVTTIQFDPVQNKVVSPPKTDNEFLLGYRGANFFDTGMIL